MVDDKLDELDTLKQEMSRQALEWKQKREISEKDYDSFEEILKYYDIGYIKAYFNNLKEIAEKNRKKAKEAAKKKTKEKEKEDNKPTDNDSSGEDEETEEEVEATEEETKEPPPKLGFWKKLRSHGASAGRGVAKATGKTIKYGGILGWKGLKKTPGAIAKGSKVTYNGIKASFDPNHPVNKPLKWLGQRTPNTISFFFLIILLLIHLFDAFVFGFGGSPQRILTMTIAYTLVTIYAVVFKYGADAKPVTYAILSALEIFLPMLTGLMTYLGNMMPFIQSSGLQTYFITAITFTPFWVLYVAFTDGEKSAKVAKIYLAGLLILALIIVFAQMSFPNFFNQAKGVNVGRPIKDFFSQVSFSFGTIKTKLTGVFNLNVIKTRINNTLNPYAKYYSGQVEQNSREKLGVYIEDLKSLTPNNYVDEKPIIMAQLVGKSFLDKTILVTPSCRIESRDYSAPGTPDPRDSIDLNYQLQRTVTCELPSQSKEGYYDAVIGANFNFETWAYITYTFVDLKTIQNYYLQNKDVNTELGIDPYPTAIYTSGPVSIGVSSSKQPIDINTEKPANEAIKQQFGFTIDNAWQQGSIKRVEEVDVLIPEEFKLDDCKPLPWSTEEQLPEEGMYKYVFSSDDFFNKKTNNNFDYRQDLRTITCKLFLRDQESMDNVVTFGSKTPATFVVMAKYNYLVEQKTRLRIEK